MKLSRLYGLTLVLSIIGCIIGIKSYAHEPALQEGSYQNVANYQHCIEQAHELVKIIPQVMHELYLHEDYWKTQKLRPLAYFLSKDPTKWIYRKQEWQKIDSSLDFIACEQEHHAYYLGLFKGLLHDFEQDSTYTEKRFIALLELIERFLSHYPHATKVYRESGKGQQETYEQRINRNAYLISYYYKNARRAVAHCSEPNHFQRNWLSYFLGTSVLMGFSYFIYKNQSKLQMWGQMGYNGLKKYYHEHVSSPIVQSLKFLFQRDRKPLMTQEGVNASERSLTRQINTYLDLCYPQFDEDQRKKVIDDALIGNLDFLLNDWDESIQALCDAGKGIEGTSLQSKYKAAMAFIDKLPNGLNVGRILDIRIHSKDVMANRAILEVEKQINANVFNFEIAAVLPSALVGYFIYSISKMLFTKLILQKNIYQPLRKSLRHLHMIYTKYMNDNDTLSTADEGFCYYWIEEFKQHSYRLLLSEQKTILDDLSELEAYDRSATQKLSIIQRMYYTYHFLLPSQD